MANTTTAPRGHTGSTGSGSTRDLRIERLGRVTIYKRGNIFWIYYRENKATRRYPVEGNLAAARAAAAKATAALEENRPSPMGFDRTSVTELATQYLDYAENVQGLGWRSVDRYRAALDRLQEFATASKLTNLDQFTEQAVEDFVKWLRAKTRARNGMAVGKQTPYKVGGIKFILSTCRTAFNWAGRRRMLPPYSENPFSRFPIDRLCDPAQEDEGQRVFTPDQERAFIDACSDWQKSLFTPLIAYGMRLGELTHLLIENVDFKTGTIEVCSKPEMFWKVKTSRRRKLPLTEGVVKLLRGLIGKRKAGFVFLNRPFFEGEQKPATAFADDRHLRARLEQIVRELEAKDPQATKAQKRRAVVEFCRGMGQVPERRVLEEFRKLTRQIGCPDFTRVHDLRHLFTTRAQERGANPLVVQQIVGHKTLDMTRRYTHLGLDTKRQVVELVAPDTTADKKD